MLMPTYGSTVCSDSGQQKQFTTMQEGNYSFSCIAVEISKQAKCRHATVQCMFVLQFAVLYTGTVEKTVKQPSSRGSSQGRGGRGRGRTHGRGRSTRGRYPKF